MKIKPDKSPLNAKMSKKFIDIHFERFDNDEELKRIVEEKTPCAMSIAPYTLRDGWYDDKILGLLRKAFEQGAVLGQQGDMHKCRHKHRFSDPWHENYCLYQGGLSIEEQRDLMERGKETLAQFFGKNPEMYVPPNHLYDWQTRVVANSMEYTFIAERGISQTLPYERLDLIVLPEAKINEKNGVIFYIHYDEIGRNRKDYEKVIMQAEDLLKISPEKVSIWEEDRNMRKVLRRKKGRDMLRFPKKIFKSVKT